MVVNMPHVPGIKFRMKKYIIYIYIEECLCASSQFSIRYRGLNALQITYLGFYVQ